MSASARLRRFSAFVLLTSASVASAHPGHDGHDLTWDFGSAFGHQGPAWYLLGLTLLTGACVWAWKRSRE